MPPPRYPSDLSDTKWVILEPLLSSSETRGRRGTWQMRSVLPAQERVLMADAASGVSAFLADRLLPLPQVEDRRGRLRRAHDDRLREAEGREAEGRDRDPSAAVIDSQVVKTTPPVGGWTRTRLRRGQASGRTKAPHILVDTSGLVLAARGHGPDLPDRDGGRRLLEGAQGLARMELVWADGAYTGGFREWLRRRRLGWRLEVPHHPDRQLWRYGLKERPRGFRVFLVVG